MTRVLGPSRDQLDALGDDYAGLVAATLAEVAHAVPDGHEVEDLGRLRTLWATRVDETLLPALGVGFEVGAATIRVALREAVGLTAAASTDLAPTADALAEAYLAQARNRLVGVGDELWAHAREELLEGLRAGESIGELAARVRKVAPDLTEPRAEQIARTEILGAVNAGALAQVLATGATGTKTWEAAHDDRVRREHEHADEQTVPLREKFTIGGFPADRPHDPSLPPHLSVSCRCALSFTLDLDSDQTPEPEDGGNGGGDWQALQRRDRSFLERVFAKGLAFMARLFRVQTAAAMIEHMSESRGDDMTEEAGTWEGAPIIEGAWEGVLVIEGSPTGDGRQFSSGALTWAELPLPLKWQEREAEGHSGAVIVGRIDAIERQGDQVIGRGVFDLEGENGREAHRLVFGRYLRGVSIQPDDISDSDVEMVFGEDQEDEVDPFARPELVVFNAGRIRSATLCAEAAFVEAEVRLTSGPAVPEAVAAAAVALDDYRPPADWFGDPALVEPTGIVVTDAGQVRGHAALWTSCHIGFANECVGPPAEADHPYFLTGEVLCADGSRVAVGQVTLGTGHAPLSHGAHAATEHYDHTGSVVADVACGNDEHGIWVAGAVRPNVDASRVHELRASGQLSGDWRRIGGQLRLVALLAVNVPGFPVPRPRARVASGDPMALVAAGKVAHEAGHDGVDLRPVKERIASSMGRDRPSRQRELAARVRAGRS